MCEDQKVDGVRKKVLQMFSRPLRIPLSADGQEPATHWMCELAVSDKWEARLLSMQKDTVMEISSRKDFLEKWGLQEIRESE